MLRLVVVVVLMVRLVVVVVPMLGVVFPDGKADCCCCPDGKDG